MILSYSDLKDPEKFACPWHRNQGGPCSMSLAGASVLVSIVTKRYSPIEKMVEEADAGERVIFWCPQCEGAIYLSPVEQGFLMGIPPI